jgi:hypothetical protein
MVKNFPFSNTDQTLLHYDTCHYLGSVVSNGRMNDELTGKDVDVSWDLLGGPSCLHLGFHVQIKLSYACAVSLDCMLLVAAATLIWQLPAIAYFGQHYTEA